MSHVFDAVAQPAPSGRDYGRAQEEIDREQRELVAPSQHLGPRGIPSDPHVFRRDEQEAVVRRIIKRMRERDRKAPRDLKRVLDKLGLEDASSFGLPNTERVVLENLALRRGSAKTKHAKKHRRR